MGTFDHTTTDLASLLTGNLCGTFADADAHTRARLPKPTPLSLTLTGLLALAVSRRKGRRLN